MTRPLYELVNLALIVVCFVVWLAGCWLLGCCRDPDDDITPDARRQFLKRQPWRPPSPPAPRITGVAPPFGLPRRPPLRPVKMLTISPIVRQLMDEQDEQLRKWIARTFGR